MAFDYRKVVNEMVLEHEDLGRAIAALRPIAFRQPRRRGRPLGSLNKKGRAARAVEGPK